MSWQNFNDSLEFTLRWEGGTVDDPDDPGGRTAYGITQRVYDEWCHEHDLPLADVFEIEQETVQQIYFHNYWVSARCDQLSDGRPRLAMALFDAAVNHGPRQSVKFVQRAVGAFPDGWLGTKTLRRIAAMPERDVLTNALGQRAAFYLDLVERRPVLRKFIKGWMNRLADLARVIGTEPPPETVLG